MGREKYAQNTREHRKNKKEIRKNCNGIKDLFDSTKNTRDGELVKQVDNSQTRVYTRWKSLECKVTRPAAPVAAACGSSMVIRRLLLLEFWLDRLIQTLSLLFLFLSLSHSLFLIPNSRLPQISHSPPVPFPSHFSFSDCVLTFLCEFQPGHFLSRTHTRTTTKVPITIREMRTPRLYHRKAFI